MGPKDVIRKTLDMGDYILKCYVKDLSDEELKLVPVEGMHPIALQIGHLISSERRMLEMIKPGASPTLPDGFVEAHDIKAANGDASRFATKDEYVKLWDDQHAATLAVLEGIPESDLDDNRDGKLPTFAPTVGVLFNMAGAHALSHVGQFVAVRRLLKKPIAF
jgi:DinB superfamily